jgi:hypothetical protein
MVNSGKYCIVIVFLHGLFEFKIYLGTVNKSHGQLNYTKNEDFTSPICKCCFYATDERSDKRYPRVGCVQ